MNTGLPNQNRAQEVLEGYAAATPGGNDYRILRDWIAQFPEFAEDLEIFAASRAIARHVPDETPTAEEEAARQTAAAELLKRLMPARGQSPSPIASLTGLAEKKGLDKAKFAHLTGLSVSLVMYLEKRRLAAASVPKALVRRVAHVLGAADESVAAYLGRPSGPLLQANFKAAKMPDAESAQKDFRQAVAEDQTLTAIQKEELLKLV